MSAGASGGVFISYRRQEASGWARLLYDRLADRFGDDQVFMDVDTIALGVDFAEVITQAVSTCQVLLAVIGPHWLTASDQGGRRRLDDPDDIVRLEIAAALERDIRVIPILVEGATMPRSQELPRKLAKLARRNALSVRHESFRVDADRLLAVIEPILRPPASAPRVASGPAPAVTPTQPQVLSEREGPPTSAAKVMLIAGLLLAVVLAMLPLVSLRGSENEVYRYYLFPDWRNVFSAQWRTYSVGAIAWLAVLLATYAAALMVIPYWRNHARAATDTTLKVGALIASSVIVIRYFKGDYDPRNELLYGAYVTIPLTLMLLVGAFLPSKSATGEHGTHVNGQSQGKAPLRELTVFLVVTLITVDIIFLPWEKFEDLPADSPAQKGLASALTSMATVNALGRIALLMILVSGLPALGAVGYWLRGFPGGGRRIALAGVGASLLCAGCLALWIKQWNDLYLWSVPSCLVLAVLNVSAMAVAVQAFRKKPLLQSS